jgi:AcrR family transcriptional regulator
MTAERSRVRPPGTRAAATRELLLRAAERVFLEDGFHDASIVRITMEAGVGHGTFYTHFESKQQIFDDLLMDLNRRLRHSLTVKSEAAPSRIEAERRGFKGIVEFAKEHPAIFRMVRQAEFQSPEIYRQHYEVMADRYRERLADAMARGEILSMSPEVLAWTLMGIAEMVAMRWSLWNGHGAPPGDVDAEEALDQIWSMLERGLRMKRRDGGDPTSSEADR